MVVQVTPLSFPLLVCAALLAWLTWQVWQRRATPGGHAFSALLASVLGWTLANIGEKSLSSLAPKIFFADFQYVFASVTPAAWYVFACRYTGRDRLAPDWGVRLLALGPLIIAGLTWFDPWLHLMRISVTLEPAILGAWGPTNTFAILYGPAFWIHAVYSYSLFVVGGVVLLEFGVRSAPQYRGQVLWMVLSMLVPLLLNIAYVFGFRPIGNFDLTPFGFTITSAVGAWAIVRERVFDLVPIARDVVLDEMPDCVFVLDGQGRVIDVNRSAETLLQRPARSLSGLPFSDVCPNVSEYLAADANRNSSSFPLNVVRLGGQATCYAVRHSRLTQGRRDMGTLVVLSDVTLRVRMEEERAKFLAAAQNSQKLESLGLLAGGIAHDFNNLLVAMLGNASLAREGTEPNSPLLPLIERIEAAAEHAADLTHQLLMYSGRKPRAMRPVSLSELVAGISDLLRWTVSKKVSLQVTIEPQLPWVQGDPSQLRQVLVNLISNASEAIGPRAGHIALSIHRDHLDSAKLALAYFNSGLTPRDHVVIEVQDDGSGMDEATLRRIFEPFYSTKSEGRGLGLAAVLGIVRGHGGALFVESASGKGSTFRVALAAVAAPVGSAAGDANDDRSVNTGGLILFADDEESVRIVAEQTFRQYGIDFQLAADGEETVQTFDKFADSIDVVVLDLSMPKLAGEEVIGRLRRRRTGVPIVVSSGYSEDEVLQHFREERPDSFLRKPYRAAELIAKIRQTMIQKAANCEQPSRSVK